MMKKLMKKLKSQKGFTLMEMLIVVAIIAILVAIAVPTFNASLTKAQQATDEANLRSAKAVAAATYLDYTYNGEGSPLTVGMKFDAETGKFVASTVDVTGYGKNGDNKDNYIVITGVADGYTVGWHS